MRTITAVSFLLMSTAAISDGVTFICADKSGKKSIQDRPCSPDSSSAEAREYKSHQPTFQQWVDGVNANAKAAQCKYLRDNVQIQSQARNDGVKARDQANQRDIYLNAKRRYEAKCS